MQSSESYYGSVIAKFGIELGAIKEYPGDRGHRQIFQ